MILGLHFWEEPALTVEEEVLAHKVILEEQERFLQWARGERKERLLREIAWRRSEIERLSKEQ